MTSLMLAEQSTEAAGSTSSTPTCHALATKPSLLEERRRRRGRGSCLEEKQRKKKREKEGEEEEEEEEVFWHHRHPSPSRLQCPCSSDREIISTNIRGLRIYLFTAIVLLVPNATLPSPRSNRPLKPITGVLSDSCLPPHHRAAPRNSHHRPRSSVLHRQSHLFPTLPRSPSPTAVPCAALRRTNPPSSPPSAFHHLHRAHLCEHPDPHLLSSPRSSQCSASSTALIRSRDNASDHLFLVHTSPTAPMPSSALLRPDLKPMAIAILTSKQRSSPVSVFFVSPSPSLAALTLSALSSSPTATVRRDMRKEQRREEKQREEEEEEGGEERGRGRRGGGRRRRRGRVPPAIR